MRACRFCLMDEATDPEPLISPCKCKGTVAHVHLKCIKLWREHSDYPERSHICQLCTEPYILPKRWQLEIIPNLLENRHWRYLSRSYVINVVCIYTNSTLVSLFTSTSSKLVASDQLYKHNYETGRSMYYGVLAMITYIYVRFYIKYLLSHIINKRLYIQYYMRNAAHTGRREWKPRGYFLLLCASALGVMFSITQYPFGIVYVYFLSQFYYTHVSILRAMNTDAEMY